MLAKSRDVSPETSLPASLFVPLDRPRMLQVFENLLKNAIEHSPAGATVSVSAVIAEDSVSIAVEDRGPGFQADDLPRIFEPFFTRRRGGTGLGLSLVLRIIEQHNGSVRAMNRHGGGATMLVTLPLR
jgi:signal transduction histidine kinase